MAPEASPSPRARASFLAARRHRKSKRARVLCEREGELTEIDVRLGHLVLELQWLLWQNRF